MASRVLPGDEHARRQRATGAISCKTAAPGGAFTFNQSYFPRSDTARSIDLAFAVPRAYQVEKVKAYVPLFHRMEHHEIITPFAFLRGKRPIMDMHNDAMLKKASRGRRK
jgi:hypothetical protein